MSQCEHAVGFLIADDHEVVRIGLRSLLEARPEWRVIGEAADGREAVNEAIRLKPDLVVIDPALPVLNGLDAIRAIRSYLPGVQILIFTTHDNDQMLCDAVAAGARGYLLKSDSKKALHMAIEALIEQRPFFAAHVLQRMLDSYLSNEKADSDPLTSQERLVVQLIAEGKANKEAARILNKSVKAVESNRATAMDKLGLSSMADLVRYAVRTKLAEA